MAQREHGRSGPTEAKAPSDVTLDDCDATIRFQTALRRALAPDEREPGEAILWVDADAELLLRPTRAHVACEDGLVRAFIPVYTDQTSETEILVPFAVGRRDAPAGLIMATETRPRGPDVIVDRWAEPLLAAAWEAVVSVAVDAAAAGRPVSISASDGRLEVTAQASVEAG